MQNRFVQLEMQIRLPVIGATLLTCGLRKLIFVFQNWQGKNKTLFTQYHYGL